MKNHDMIRTILMSLMFMVAAMTSANAQQSGTSTPAKVYDENVNQMEQLDQALAKASSEGKYVISQVGGNWCPWCLRFAKFITDDADIASLISRNFVYIHTNYPRRGGGNSDPARTEVLKSTLKRLGSPERFGFPVFVVLDATGKVLHIQDSSFLEEGQGYDKQKVLRFLNNWTPQAVTGTKE